MSGYVPAVIKHMGTAVSGDDGKHWTNHHDTSLDEGGQWSDWIEGFDFTSTRVHAGTWHYHVTRYQADSIPSDPNTVVANAVAAINSGLGTDVTFPEHHPPTYWYYQVMLSVFQDANGGHGVGDSTGYNLSVDGGKVLVDIGYVARTFHPPTGPQSTLPSDLSDFPYATEIELFQPPDSAPRNNLAAGGYLDFESDSSTFSKWVSVGDPNIGTNFGIQNNFVDASTIIRSDYPDAHGSFAHNTFPLAFHIGSLLEGGSGTPTGRVSDGAGYEISANRFDGDPVPGPFFSPSDLSDNPSLGVHEVDLRRSHAYDTTHNLGFDVSNQGANAFTLYVSPAFSPARLASGYFTAGVSTDVPGYDYAYVTLGDLGCLYGIAKYTTPRWRYWIPGSNEPDGQGGTITHNYYAADFSYGVPALRTREQLTVVGLQHQNIIKPPAFNITDTHGFWRGRPDSGARASLAILNYEAGGTGQPAESSVTFKRSST